MQASIRVRIVSLVWVLAILLLVLAWLTHTIRAESVQALNDVNNEATEVYQAISRAKVELERHFASARASETSAQAVTQDHVRATYEEILRSHANMHILFQTIWVNGGEQNMSIFVAAKHGALTAADVPLLSEVRPRHETITTYHPDPALYAVHRCR